MIYPSAMPLQTCKLSHGREHVTQRKAAFHEWFSLEWRVNHKTFLLLPGQLEDSSTKESPFFPHNYYSLDNPRERPYQSCNFPSLSILVSFLLSLASEFSFFLLKPSDLRISVSNISVSRNDNKWSVSAFQSERFFVLVHMAELLLWCQCVSVCPHVCAGTHDYVCECEHQSQLYIFFNSKVSL